MILQMPLDFPIFRSKNRQISSFFHREFVRGKIIAGIFWRTAIIYAIPDTNFMMGGVEVKIDTALILDAQRGGQESFTKLYQAVEPSLYRTALYTLGNNHDAEDVVSETFIEAYRGLAGLRDPQAFVPWIFRILSARCNRKIREYVRARGEVDIDQMLELPGEQSEFSEEVLQRTDLVRAMQMLSDEERQIVVLSVLQGYTAREIAVIMNSPQGTVSSKLFRAFKKMRKYLEGGKQS